jgi:hypothetical protein
VTTTTDDIIPEGFDRWPRAVQRHYIEELYALYFPGRAHQAADAAVPQPGDEHVVQGEIVN